MGRQWSNIIVSIPGLAGLLWLAAVALPGSGQTQQAVQFNRDIRPILSNNCFTCHGPDHGQRKAKLRLDQAEDALAPHENGTPIVPGQVGKSELVKRISSADPDEQMPPPKSGKKLSA